MFYFPWLDKEKRSSLFRLFSREEEKKFYNIGPRRSAVGAAAAKLSSST
jgi:hypothetical protein